MERHNTLKRASKIAVDPLYLLLEEPRNFGKDAIIKF